MSEHTKSSVSEWASWPLEREIVIARVVDADRRTAFSAWTDPSQIVQWFGPEGFGIETHEIDIGAGGVWRFEMVAPDGTRYSNRMEFLRVEAPRLIEASHGTDADDDPNRFRMLVTFDEQDNGKTVVTLRQMHPTPERRATVIGFGAVEYGAETLDKLANHVADQPVVAEAKNRPSETRGATMAHASFELRRQSDSLVYAFTRQICDDGTDGYKRADDDYWIVNKPGLDWVAWDFDSHSVMGRPWDVQPGDQSDHPPEGDWVSKKGSKSYVYTLVYV